MSSHLPPQILTIGHSNHTIERFLELLRKHGVSAVADVRSSPYSQYNPQFNREQLQAALKPARIGYVYLGDELGARRSEPECYLDGKARYDLICKTPRFQEGLKRVQKGAMQHRLALTCAEKDPITCHRAILVCRHLRPFGIPISHILDSGELETTAAMEQRLLMEAGCGEGNLFVTDPAAEIEYAYDLQGDRIAYTEHAVAAQERD
jgi:uncharacterized protein (DUF488 family)